MSLFLKGLIEYNLNQSTLIDQYEDSHSKSRSFDKNLNENEKLTLDLNLLKKEKQTLINDNRDKIQSTNDELNILKGSISFGSLFKETFNRFNNTSNEMSTSNDLKIDLNLFDRSIFKYNLFSKVFSFQ